MNMNADNGFMCGNGDVPDIITEHEVDHPYNPKNDGTYQEMIKTISEGVPIGSKLTNRYGSQGIIIPIELDPSDDSDHFDPQDPTDADFQ